MSDRVRRIADSGPRDTDPSRVAASGVVSPSIAARACPACGAMRVSVYGAGHEDAGASTRTVRCEICTLVYVDRVPPEAISPASYGPGYYEPWQERLEVRARLRLWRRRLRQVRARRDGGSLLDVGCGDGMFLQVAREAGFRVEGIEFSPEGARLASARLGRPVGVGDLARVPGVRGPFDIVTLWHVLEHLPAPGPMLEAVRARLCPGGLLVAAVPNLGNLPMRAAYRLVRGRPLPLYEEGAREPHLSHFDPVSLRAFLERRGFERIEVRADRCALTLPKRAIDSIEAVLSFLTRRLLSDAIVAFARRPG